MCAQEGTEDLVVWYVAWKEGHTHKVKQQEAQRTSNVTETRKVHA